MSSGYASRTIKQRWQQIP